MKTLFKTIALFAIFTLFFTSCGRDDSSETNDPTNPTGPFVAKVNDTQFATDNSTAKAKFVASTKMLQVIAQTSDNKETLYFNLMAFGNTVNTAGDWKPGTYDFDPIRITEGKYLASGIYTFYNGAEYINWNTNWDYVKTGKITIESNTGTHIKGTFHFDTVKQNSDGTFDASNIKKITAGGFDLDITVH